MAQTTANYGAELTERLADPVSQWRLAIGSFERSMRVALPCVVVSFDSVKQTIVAQPAVTELERVAGVLTVIPLQPLYDVPVLLPRAGGFTLTLPIAAGDECLIVFSDLAFDAWWQSGGSKNNQLSQRRHDLNDGVAILGPWSQPRVLASYSTTSAQLRSDNGQTMIDVAATQVTVTAQTVNVNASSTATVAAPTVNVNGSSQVNISGAGNTTIESRNFLNHVHHNGASVTGTVV